MIRFIKAAAGSRGSAAENVHKNATSLPPRDAAFPWMFVSANHVFRTGKRLVLWGSAWCDGRRVCSFIYNRSGRRRRGPIGHAQLNDAPGTVALTDSQTVQSTRRICTRVPAHCQIILLVIDSSRCEACAAERGKDATTGWVLTNCFRVLSVWNELSVCFKPWKQTLSSICTASKSCHAQGSSFTRVKPTFTACARLAGPCFLKRAEEELIKLATF